MGRDADGRNWTPGWAPPKFTVDDDGKIVGYVNERQPNNWGRFGELDERGTANFITPEKVVEAAGLVRTGEIISCAIPLDSTGPVHPVRSGPLHMYRYTGSDYVAGTEMMKAFPHMQATDDYIFMPLQGSTQWDGLAHMAFDDALYNGFWFGNVEAFAGAKRCSIHQLSRSLVGRGVLLDVARHKGLDRLEPAYPITPADLDAAAEAHGVEIRSGDILIVRTGHLAWWYQLENKMDFWAVGAPGLSRATVEWVHEKEVAAIAMDNIAVEVEPFEEPYEHPYPLHSRFIRDLGVSLGEVWWLEDLADSCARDGRYEFFVSAPPLNITNASGSPINPVVIK